jgi:hypothetical protein
VLNRRCAKRGDPALIHFRSFPRKRESSRWAPAFAGTSGLVAMIALVPFGKGLNVVHDVAFMTQVRAPDHVGIASSDGDEAVQLFRDAVDCSASLAMTRATQVISLEHQTVTSRRSGS